MKIQIKKWKKSTRSFHSRINSQMNRYHRQETLASLTRDTPAPLLQLIQTPYRNQRRRKQPLGLWPGEHLNKLLSLRKPSFVTTPPLVNLPGFLLQALLTARSNRLAVYRKTDRVIQSSLLTRARRSFQALCN